MKPKATRKRRAVEIVGGDEPAVMLSPAAIKWGLSAVAAVLGVIVVWWQVWDRIDAHWRLETVQAAQDKALKADIQAAKDKADADVKELARRAEVGRAWLFWSVTDGKAVNTSQWAELCKFLKRPGDVCVKYEQDAAAYRQEAVEAKRAATAAGREK